MWRCAVCNRRSPTFNALNLPDIYRNLISETMEGLILVCGVTGSGKSSTLAAMIEYINQHRGLHIITIEDPIEFAFHGKKSIISQREIGLDVPNFHDALRSGRAAGPGRDSDRRDARPRDDAGGHSIGRNRPPGVGLAALRRCPAELRPHPGVLRSHASTASSARRWPTA